MTALLLSFALPSTASAQVATQASPSATPDDLKQRAEAEYELGVAAYREGRFADAVGRFLAADRLLPSAALSFNVARAYEKLANDPGALRFYRDYLRRETGPANPNVEAARSRVVELEAALMARGVQQLTVLSQPESASLSIDGQPLGVTPWTGELPPGAHRLSLSRPGHSPVLRDFELSRERAMELSLLLPALSPVTSAAPPPATQALAAPGTASDAPESARFGPWPWVTVGAGGVLLLAAGGFELSRRSAESDAKTPGLAQISYNERLNAMHSRQTTARALVAVGGVLAVTGGVLILLQLGRSPAPRATAALVCAPQSCLGNLAVSY